MDNPTRTVPKRPALRYHGGKWRLAPWIISYFGEHRVYVEPFAGAASVLLRKPPSPIEVYNDLDERVVSLFRILRDTEKSERLRLLLNLTPISRAEHRYCRYPCGEEIEDARRLIVRSFQGVGAAAPTKDVGWRTRFKLRFNYQMSWNGWPDQMPIFVERLKEVLIEALPWQNVIDKYEMTTPCSMWTLPM